MAKTLAARAASISSRRPRTRAYSSVRASLSEPITLAPTWRARSLARAPRLALAPLAALGRQRGPPACLLAVLPGEERSGSVGRVAQITAVDDQALLCPLQLHEHLGDRRVGGFLDLGPDPAPDRVDPGRHLDIDYAVQV